ELDVDAEVVGVELELVAVEQGGIRIDVHDEPGNRAVELEPPVPVARRLGLKIDVHGGRVRGECLVHGMQFNTSREGISVRKSAKPLQKCTIVHTSQKRGRRDYFLIPPSPFFALQPQTEQEALFDRAPGVELRGML